MTKIWTCKIGEVPSVPSGADAPMRDAVADAYRQITGQDPAFIFSGWGGELEECERAVVENRLPILATRTDATPVAEPRTIYVQWADNGNIRKWAWSEFDLAEKLNVETAPVSDTPFAWAYHYTRKHPGQTKPGAMDIKRDRHNGPISAGWTETPLYTHPPATDVAALVEAAKETNAALERDGDPAFAHLILANKAALAPFTKGQNDE